MPPQCVLKWNGAFVTAADAFQSLFGEIEDLEVIQMFDDAALLLQVRTRNQKRFNSLSIDVFQCCPATLEFLLDWWCLEAVPDIVGIYRTVKSELDQICSGNTSRLFLVKYCG